MRWVASQPRPQPLQVDVYACAWWSGFGGGGLPAWGCCTANEHLLSCKAGMRCVVHGACFCKPVVVACAVTTHCPQYPHTYVLCVLHQSHIASLLPCGQPQHSVLTDTLMVRYYYLTYYTVWMPDCCSFPTIRGRTYDVVGWLVGWLGLTPSLQCWQSWCQIAACLVVSLCAHAFCVLCLPLAEQGPFLVCSHALFQCVVLPALAAGCLTPLQVPHVTWGLEGVSCSFCSKHHSAWCGVGVLCARTVTTV